MHLLIYIFFSGHSRLLNGLETPEKFIQLIDAHRSKVKQKLIYAA